MSNTLSYQEHPETKKKLVPAIYLSWQVIAVLFLVNSGLVSLFLSRCGLEMTIIIKSSMNVLGLAVLLRKSSMKDTISDFR